MTAERTMLTREEWETHTYEQKEANAKVRRRGWSTDQVCHLCNKAMSTKAFDTAWHVHMDVDGNLHAVDVVVPECDDQGWFPVGVECRKALPKNFTKRWSR